MIKEKIDNTKNIEVNTEKKVQQEDNSTKEIKKDKPFLLVSIGIMIIVLAGIFLANN
ncbi:hypothetical protein J7L48_04825 [bacterium]|nr:hypothetical protein [bacterium]